jgi:hypothetical protein
VVINELTAIVWVNLTYWEGQAGQYVAEAIFHDTATATQDGDALTPSRCDVDQLQGMNVVTSIHRISMVNQVCLKVT